MAHRRFTDNRGNDWDVWEVYPTIAERRVSAQEQDVVVERRKHRQFRASLPEHLQTGWLAFEHGRERRRLAPTPELWQHLTDAELSDLLERAEAAGTMRRLIE